MGNLLTSMIGQFMNEHKMGKSSTTMLGPNFGFGFNNKIFSDRVLRIEIIADDTLPSKQMKHEFMHAVHATNDSRWCKGNEIKSFHVSSIILAAKSPFFYKLFHNGMIESQRTTVTLKITRSEKNAFMDLIHFMYSNTLSATTSADLLDVLMVADKFNVTSCMTYCVELLLMIPMSLDYALLCLELPATEEVQPLIDASKKYLVLQDFNKFQGKAMKLPLSILEVVLGFDGLRVDSEDEVYEFILKWARAHYSNLAERREIINNHLARLICFPHMSCSKLKEVLTCTDFHGEEVSKLVVDSLFYKIEFLTLQDIDASKNLDNNHNCGGHIYHDRLARLKTPSPHRVVYFDLKREECINLFTTKDLYSKSFVLGGRLFYLHAECRRNQDINGRFALFVCIPKGSQPCRLDFELAVMKKASNNFESRYNIKNHDLTDNGWGLWDLLGMKWADFISENNDYFIDGILHLRLVLTLNSQA